MTDYGHNPWFGVFVPPVAEQSDSVLELARRADAVGLDVFAIQDHPYQPAFLDAWTLLSALAVETARIRLFPDVANLPLRLPSVLARSAASIDILSDGRFELGLGAGAFWDAIEANGGPRRTPGEALVALEEAMTIIRAIWTPGRGPRVDGKHYRVRGPKTGPQPPHRIGIWVGGYGPRMLKLIGRLADGWVPSAGYLPPDQLGERSRILDEAAQEVGRDPAQIRRAYNLNGRFAERGAGFLQGPATQWIEQLTELTLDHGTSVFILAVEATGLADLDRFAQEVAPGVRELVAKERAAPRDETELHTDVDVSPEEETSEQGRTNQQ